MSIYEKDVDNIKKHHYYKMRPSYLNQAKHLNDNFKNMGYDYTGQILKKGTSPELWANPQQIGMIGQLEGLLTYLLESAKSIKKWYSFAHNKNTTIIN